MNSCSKDSVWSVYVAMFRQYAEHGKGRALSLQWILVATVLSFGNSSGKFKKREEAQTLKGSVLYSMNALETMIQNIQQKGPRDNITSKRLMSLSDPDRFRIHIQLRISFSQNYSKIFNLSFFTSHFISHSWSTTTPLVILKIWKRLQIIKVSQFPPQSLIIFGDEHCFSFLHGHSFISLPSDVWLVSGGTSM